MLLKNDSALEGDIQLLELNESWSPLEAVMAQSSNDQTGAIRGEFTPREKGL